MQSAEVGWQLLVAVMGMFTALGQVVVSSDPGLLFLMSSDLWLDCSDDPSRLAKGFSLCVLL